MKRKVSLFFISIIFTISSFIFFLTRIERVPFETDEAYWVSTGKIIPILLKGRFSDPFWQEYYGFTNFNGAKYIFGLGLALFGHKESEINEAGVAPYTYYHWLPDEGKVLPKNHILFPLIRDSRIISAFFTAISIGLMVIASFLLFQNLLLSSSAAIVLFAHPITQYVAIRARENSILFCFIMLFLCGVLFILKRKVRYPYTSLIVLGGITAYLISIKIVGVIFPFAFSISLVLFSILWNQKYGIKYILTVISLVMLSTLGCFLLLEPNLFFFREYSLFQMIEDRITITGQHTAYFSSVNPSYVTLSILDRLYSFIKYVFPLWFLPIFVLGIASSFLRRNESPRAYPIILTMTGVVMMSVLSYAVFDEIRYFLPVLPFVVLISIRVLLRNKN